jgi:hypothetical protein
LRFRTVFDTSFAEYLKPRPRRLCASLKRRLGVTLAPLDVSTQKP